MTSMFRIATKEAIREIVIENCHQGRFGFVLSSDDLDLSADKIVDLFETTLELRGRVQERMNSAPSTNSNIAKANTKKRSDYRPQVSNTLQNPGFPRSVNAAEIYEVPNPEYRKLHVEQVPQAPAMDHKLPRKRISLTEAEREKMYRPQ